MHLAFAKVPGAERVIERLFIRSNRIQATEAPEGEKPPFIVPRLGIRRQGELELFSPDHFLDLPWSPLGSTRHSCYSAAILGPPCAA
jgi:type III restriction enzyme